MRATLLVSLVLATHPTATAQQPPPTTPPPAAQAGPLDGRGGRELLLRNFRPRPELQVAQTDLQQARFPVVDVHTHFYYRQRHNRAALEDFVDLMDRPRLAICASLDGKLGAQLEEHLDFLWQDHRDRFVVFANIDWQGTGTADAPASWACNQSGFIRQTVHALQEAKQQGISGVKVFKQFGLGYRDASGKLLRVDDPRWDPIWEACGELGLPVLIHTADPVAFFRPIDEHNERWEELSRHPDWSFVHDEPGEDFPTHAALIAARNRVFARHSGTNFIAAHVGSRADNLAVVSEWLDRYPNLYIDPSSRISELGRQPYTARDFLIKYADRVLFGTDGPWPETRIKLYWRFLETRDEYFPYSEKPFPPQGFWRIYGVHLPPEVLRKIYSQNAARIVPGVAERLAALPPRLTPAAQRE